jgi:uncharacterized membrane protein
MPTRSFPTFLLIGLLLLGLLWAFAFTQAVTFSFGKLGLSPEAALLILMGSLLGGGVNIPVSRRRVYRRWPHGGEPWDAYWPWQLGGPGAARWWGDVPLPLRLFFYRPPVVREQVIAVNLGGALIPLAVSLYVIPRAPLVPLLAATAGVAAVCYAVARPAWPYGIVIPTFVPPAAALALALVLAPDASAPVAYIAGTLGTLIGADLLHLGDLKRFDAQLLSIGGAGVHDGIFFAGLVAALLA